MEAARMFVFENSEASCSGSGFSMLISSFVSVDVSGCVVLGLPSNLVRLISSIEIAKIQGFVQSESLVEKSIVAFYLTSSPLLMSRCRASSTKRARGKK